MKKTKETLLDYSIKENAEWAKNKIALICAAIMNMIIALAYLIEVVKKTRSIGSYAIVAALCILPCVFAILVYKKQKDSGLVRYISGVGFMCLYAYIMMTTTTDLTFCYVIVLLVAFVVYVDFKFLAGLGISALVINIAVIIKKVVQGTFDATSLTNAEVIVACLILTTVFTILAIKKVAQINDANIAKADQQRQHSDELLNTTLGVASSMTSNIEEAVGETEQLKEMIGNTQRAMETLVADTNAEVEAIGTQRQSTEKINEYILGVGDAVESIVNEVDSTEEKLAAGNLVMSDLLDQVRVSEQSNAMVVQKMEGLRESAGKMQDILEMIRNVADQTGLLALNASIEAARAGEAGRGFAVVATEITNLSTQTNDATGDIDKLIEEIVHAVEDVTAAMNKLLESSQMQNQYVNNTADNFNGIHTSTQNIAQQVAHLKETVEIVTEENRLVSEQIENVSEIMQRVMNGANSTYETCNVNLESVANVATVMDNLGAEAERLNR
nr:hypothetical protein [Lachnospiraceae bacterium]